MGVIIQSKEALEYALSRVKGRRKILGFLLFDERPSHEAIQHFADKQLAWLDDLAASASMFLFVFLATGEPEYPPDFFAERPLTREEGRRMAEIERNTPPRNPSLAVARMLGIQPN